MTLQSVLVVYKRSAYQRYSEDERDPRILRLISQDHFTVQELRRRHQSQREALDRVATALEHFGVNNRFVQRADVRDTHGHDLVLSVGGDGTFLDTSHHVRDTPMLGVSSSPTGNLGLFCGATARTVRTVLGDLLDGKLEPVVLNRMGLNLNGHAIVEPVLSEALICSQIPASPSRYVLEVGRRREHQKGAGLFIGPAAGSAGAIRVAGGEVLPLDSKKIQFLVREPFVDPGSQLALGQGVVASGTLRVHSVMHDGTIYIDGPRVRYRFAFGDELQVILEFLPLTAYGVVRQARSRGRARTTKTKTKKQAGKSVGKKKAKS